MDTFLPSSYHHSNYEGRHQNPHSQQYQLATRLEQSRRSRGRTRSPERPAAGLPSGADTSGSYGNLRGGVVKTIDTDLTRYQNTSSFRGTTPPQRLRYIYRPDQEVPKDYLASDGRHRTWEEVPFDAKYKPKSYRDRNGIEWLPVLSREASEQDWSSWESRERRRVAGWERRERDYMDHHEGMHSPEWEETHQSIHPSFLRYRNRDGSSALLTPSGNRPMTLLDSRVPWHDREYHHVGRDPIANYQTIFGGLEAEQERQRILSVEEAAREKEYHKHLRKEKRDWEHARRKEEKMMLKYDLELQKMDAKKAQQIADEGQLKVVKRIVHHADGRDEVKFVKVRVGGKQQQHHQSSSHHGHHHHHHHSSERHRSTSPRIAPVKPVHAPWGSSVAAHRNASRISAAERNLGHSLTPNAQHALSILNAAERRALGIGGAMAKRANSSRPATASGWLNPATREESKRRAARSRSGSRSRSRSRSSSRSRSRSTSSSRRRAQRRRDREIKHALKEEAKRKRDHAKKNSAGIQAGTGDLPLSADHPRSSDLEAYLLQQEKERQKLAVNRLGSTLNSLDKLSLGGVGAPTRQQIRAAKAAAAAAGGRRSRSVSSASSSERSGSSSSSGFSSRSNSRSRSRSSSRSSRSSPRRHHRSRKHSHKHSRSRSRSSSSRSRSRSGSRSRSRSSSSSSSSSSRSSHRHSKKHHHHSNPRKRDWNRRESFESMDKRIRSNTEEKWLREWRKRYDKAGSDRQKRALKQEKKDWLARRAMQHTLVQTANQPQVNDQYLVRSAPSPNTIGGIEVGTVASPDGSSPAVSHQSSHGILLDQYGTPISQYGTVYPKPSGNLLQQASVLEQYAAASAHSAKLLEETRDNVERSTKGIENIIDGLRNGYATKGMDLTEAQQNQQALHISLRAAIRAREDRRKKNEAMQRANRNVLDELRRQEAVIMDRSKAVEENIALSAYEKAMKGQQLRLAQQQQQIAIQQALAAQAARAADGESEEAMMKRLNGRRPKTQVNLALGLDNQAQVDPYWFERKDVTFTANMIEYNNGLKSALAHNGVDF